MDSKGSVSDFTKSEQDGLASVFGIKVDPKKKILWACSSPTEEMEHYDSSAISAVYKYNIESGKLIAKYIYADGQGSVFGDLTLDNQGRPFISDTKSNTIYTVDENNGTLKVYFASSEFWNIQGISFDPKNKFLFIADYIKGLYRLNLQTRELIAIGTKVDLSLKSIDGLTTTTTD